MHKTHIIVIDTFKKDNFVTHSNNLVNSCNMILHIDMDAFYASVEQRDNPDLKGKCVIVGGTSKRGVVSAASYEARKFGIHSAMPIYKVRALCPDAVFLSPRINRYKDVSESIMVILNTFSPLVEQVSIDEAYLDMSGTLHIMDNLGEIAMDIKNTIRQKCHLTCSIGAAPNKFLAKIASDMNKPDGLFIIMPEQATQFIETLPIGKVPGVGKKTEKTLELLGIQTLGQINRFPQKTLIKKLGKYGHRLIELAAAEDHSCVTPSAMRRSVSSETTLQENTRDIGILEKQILLQAEDVARQLRSMGKKAKTITLKIKYSDFKQITRSKSITPSTSTGKTIYKEAKALFQTCEITKSIRLIGVGASGLTDPLRPVQMELFKNTKKTNNRWEKVEKAVDSINKKYGKQTIEKAVLKKINSP